MWLTRTPCHLLQMHSRGQTSLRLARSSCVGMHPPAAGNEHLARISAALLRSSAGPHYNRQGSTAGAQVPAQSASSAGVT